MTHPCFWAVLNYRLGHLAWRMKLWGVRALLLLPCLVMKRIIQLCFDITLEFSAEIGPGFQIGHPGGVRLAPGVRIGSNVTIVNEVTIGRDGRPNKGVPTIGNNVFIGVGARILGAVTVGDNVSIGANAVVIHDVPPNGLAVGVPARFIPKDMSSSVADDV